MLLAGYGLNGYTAFRRCPLHFMVSTHLGGEVAKLPERSVLSKWKDKGMKRGAGGGIVWCLALSLPLLPGTKRWTRKAK